MIPIEILSEDYRVIESRFVEPIIPAKIYEWSSFTRNHGFSRTTLVGTWVGYRWTVALGCYAVLLIPGFIQVGYYYFYSSQVRRGFVYGDQPRNRLDLYLPKNMNGPKPVVAFVTGGAWIIGYKALGSLLGQQLSERDIIVACIDYRLRKTVLLGGWVFLSLMYLCVINFPQGTISDMVKEASQGISFICNKIAEYGGDPNRIYLMGQSAGAHIAACTLLEQAIKEADAEQRACWSVSQIKAYFGLSGGYVLVQVPGFIRRRVLFLPLGPFENLKLPDEIRISIELTLGFCFI
ncbi:Isoprenylcysteine alpha-carbonyl methylesterase ICME [Capsicum annuum]|nr:Isoprenylcysteine alpha-carbonyl methylesterase ICME [Capsicum annuum]